jgi:hypothetical protein
MSDQSSFSAGTPQKAQLIRTVGTIAALWTVSDLGYYFLLPAIGVEASYNAGSIAVMLYYVFLVGIAVITFSDLYRKWTAFEFGLTSYVVWSVSFAGCTLFAAYLLPLLPQTNWAQTWRPPEVVVATPLYFLPKSIEILFQQLLIVALVLALSAQRYSIARISVYCAALFGGMHILLAFGEVPWGYVIRFMLAATAFGSIFPYLILRLPNGLAYSYIVHWFYYAITVVMPRILSSHAQ